MKLRQGIIQAMTERGKNNVFFVCFKCSIDDYLKFIKLKR
jgi:hypothetical protein